MPEYTFILDCAATVTAESEAEARELLHTTHQPMDSYIGSCGVYFTPDAIASAELTEIYTPESIEEILSDAP